MSLCAYTKYYGVASAFLFALSQFALAADDKEARVTEMVRDVRLLEAQAEPRPAKINETVRKGQPCILARNHVRS